MHQVKLSFLSGAACRGVYLHVGSMFPYRTHGCVFSAAHLLRGTKLLWCTFRLVASNTHCRQVECCSLCCTAPIFLTLSVAMWPAGQTMGATSKAAACERCCLSWCFSACWEHVSLEDAWLCILSSPPSPGHEAFVVYIPIGGVQHALQTSRVLLLVLHCTYIPDPVGCYVASRANHGCNK